MSCQNFRYLTMSRTPPHTSHWQWRYHPRQISPYDNLSMRCIRTLRYLLQSLWRSLTVVDKAVVRDNKPREPPPPATPLDFPRCRPQASSYPSNNDVIDEQDLVKIFTNILRTGPSTKHLEALNISLVDEVPLGQLVPSDYIPPTSWLQDPSSDENNNENTAAPSTSQTLSNGAPIPSRKAFYDSVKELSYDNEDAFRAIRREPPLPNRKPTKVIHFRKFWDNLNLMGDFWDTSLDQYAEDPEDTTKSAMDIDELRSESHQADQAGETAKEEATEKKKTYTGRRTDTGRNMPVRYREDTVFAFVETLVWAFRCRLQNAQMPPKLKMHGMMVPLPHIASVYRQPKDRERARSLVSEGPLLGMYCRDQTCFRRPDEEVGHGKQETMDLLKESGMVLMLAQKRAREGKEEEKPGQDKWWANAPRWGGGKGGEVGGDKGEAVEEPESSDAPRKRTKKVVKANNNWEIVRPPSSTWEKNVAYQQIGRNKSTEYDDVSPSTPLL